MVQQPSRTHQAHALLLRLRQQALGEVFLIDDLSGHGIDHLVFQHVGHVRHGLLLSDQAGPHTPFFLQSPFASQHRRWGYRRVWVKAHKAGVSCGRDVVHRLWCKEGFVGFSSQRLLSSRCLPAPNTAHAASGTSLRMCGHWTLQFDS
ncbi:IS3 family transposase, partial [Corynebacterium diphtheriae]